MIRISVETRGVDALKGWLEQRGAVLRGASKTVELFFSNPRRNQTIAAVQASQDRNPFFTTAQEQRMLTRLAQEGVFDALRTNNARRLSARLEHIGDLMVANAERHIMQRKSGGTPPVSVPTSPHQTRALNPEYAKQKRKKYGSALPELVATGQFVSSFRSRVRP